MEGIQPAEIARASRLLWHFRLLGLLLASAGCDISNDRDAAITACQNQAAQRYSHPSDSLPAQDFMVRCMRQAGFP